MLMNLTRLFERLWAGRCACLLLAACLAAAPLASEAAAEAEAANECAAADVAAASPDDHAPGHANGEHDHHAHSCGGCHLHFLNVRLAPPAAGRTVATRTLPKVSDAPRDAPPGGLFRPPRI